MENYSNAHRKEGPALDQCKFSGRVFVLDPSTWGRRMADALREIGIETFSEVSIEGVLQRCDANIPMAVILELEFASGRLLDFITEITTRHPTSRIVIVTTHASVGNATAVLRAGAYDYITKPVAPAIVMDVIGVQVQPVGVQHMSLDQIRWRHIQDTLMEAGSISSAARTLGIDRRSFRRMIQRYTSIFGEYSNQEAKVVDAGY